MAPYALALVRKNGRLHCPPRRQSAPNHCRPATGRVGTARADASGMLCARSCRRPAVPPPGAVSGMELNTPEPFASLTGSARLQVQQRPRCTFRRRLDKETQTKHNSGPAEGGRPRAICFGSEGQVPALHRRHGVRPAQSLNACPQASGVERPGGRTTPPDRLSRRPACRPGRAPVAKSRPCANL